jgi:ubiquinone/menaquinone biosynthesis C-methylase UbiE
MSEKQVNNFDEFAKDYRGTLDKTVKITGADTDYFAQYKATELLRYEKPNISLSILDYGCGNANGSAYLKKYFPNAEICGVDISVESIKQAAKKNIPDSNFLIFDGIDLPFVADNFDIVFSSMVFHHVEPKYHCDVIREIYRVLKNGGRFYNFEHNPKNPVTKKIVRECIFDKDAVLLLPSYSKLITKKTGLTNVKIKYTLFFPRYKLFKPFLKFERLLTWCPIGAQYYIRGIK